MIPGQPRPDWTFLTPPSPALLCPICQELLRAPLITSGCSHSFCASCIHRALQQETACPLCRARILDGDLHPNLALSSVCEDIQVWCPYREDGCTATLRVAAASHHMSSCLYRPGICGQSDAGCHWEGRMIDAEEHKRVCAFVQLAPLLQSLHSKIASLEQALSDQQVKVEQLSYPTTSPPDASPTLDLPPRDPHPWASHPFRSIKTLTGHPAGFTSIAQHNDLMYAGAHDGSIQIFSLDGSDHMVGDTQAHDMSVWALTYHPVTNTLISGSKDGKIKIWDIQEEGLLSNRASIHGYGGKIYALLPSGDTVHAASSDGQIRTWHIPSGECISTLPAHHDSVNSIIPVPSSPNQIISASSDSTIKIWDTETGQMVRQIITYPTSVLGLAIDGSESGLLYASTHDALIHALDWRSPEPSVALIEGNDWEVWNLAVTHGSLWSGGFDHSLRRWDLRSQAPTGQWREHAGYIHALLPIPGGIATACADKTVRLWSGE